MPHCMKFSSPWMDLSIRDLYYLLELNRRGSLRLVARDLGVAPSLLSKLIRRAEGLFGVTLFFRSSLGLRPNPEVDALWRKIRALVETSGEFGTPTVREFALSISAASFLCQHLLTKVLAARPELHASRLLEVSDKVALSLAATGGIDVQIGFASLAFPRAWETVRVGDIRSALYARPDHPLVRDGNAQTEEAIAAYEFVTPLDFPESGLEYGIDHCPLRLSARRRGLAVTTANTALDWISRTDQLTFVPEMVATIAVAEGRVSEVRCQMWPEVWSPIFLAYNAEKLKKSTLGELLRGLRASCAKAPVSSGIPALV